MIRRAMTPRELKRLDVEELILRLCSIYSDESNRARTEEKMIIEELANRGTVNKNYMRRLYNLE